ncbi:MAG: methionyl-tRNA formyltransferase [Candidatus Muproteobacteria bacterium RBG_16_65_31]|uniref:Methionyl-tRNA formyltransferase n=1 Tax=Candidatus Muproteobacteria bacterium RBG_16_65_31 TaxID=1817759 RepID=A0A1F6TJ69_9PROT|nr:MAG: methionyl-tRNA formyltransferase [Candidatus Muproteobacteria bacterium RBG_16_65_31]
MNLIFAGTPAFAVPALEALLRAGHRILAVYTQPDRPAGRGRRLAASSVKEFALAHGLEVRQPETIKGRAEELKALNPDAMVVIAYGVLLPPEILAVPKHGCINVHASLLPRWRGAAPIARALEAGDAVTGVTIMRMDAGLDTGPMLHKVETPIRADDTAQTLHDRLAALGADALVAALAALARGALEPRPQDEAGACYAGKLKKAEARLDWTQPAAVIHRRIRAFNPWPVASTVFAGKTIRLWEVGPLEPGRAGAAPGTVARADAGGIRVCAGDGEVNITRLQAEGGRALAAADFLNGFRLAPGDRFVR